MSKTRIETAVRWALYEAYNHKCFYCDKPIEWNISISIHYKI